MNVAIKRISCFLPKTVIAMCLLLVSCIFFSCNQSEQTHIDRLERQYIDSLVRSQRGIGALEKIRDSFIVENNPYGLMVTCRVLGQCYRSENRFMEAIKCHRLGMEQAVLLSDTLELIQALNNLGTNYRRLGILDDASTCHYRALSFCEMLSNKADKFQNIIHNTLILNKLQK